MGVRVVGKTPPGQLKQVDQPGKTRPVKDPREHSDNGKHLGQQKDDKDKATPTQGSHPGQGIYRRSERANEVAQNTCKNKHLAADHCAEEGGATGDTTSTSPAETTSEAGTSPDEVAVFEVSPPDLFDEDSSAAYAELIKVSMGEQLFYYHPDHLGSTSYVTRENGKIHEHIQYFPFGETWVQQGGNTEKSPYLFTSKELDEETGLYYFGARYYDPRTSVWQSADPIIGKYLRGAGGGVYETANLGMYTYVRNSPTKLIDPDGNMPIVPPVPVQGASGGFVAAGAIGHSGGYQPASGVPTGPSPLHHPRIEMLQALNKYIFTVGQSVEFTKMIFVQGLGFDIIMMNKNSRELGRNMSQAGMERPSGTAAHHIVQAGDKRHAEAQGILKKFGIDINRGFNSLVQRPG